MGYPVFYVPAGDVLPVMFTSYDGGTGASVTLTGLAVTDIEIYKDGSVTQRSSDAGYTLLDTDGIDFDAITGIHGFSIDTGDNTDASFYTVGAWFTVVVSAVTIDAQTVNFIACQFRLMAAESIAGKPKVDVDAWLGTAAATPTVAGVPEVDLTHVAGATTNVAALATNVDAILTDTAVIGATGAGLTSLASAANLATVAGYLDTEIAAILADTNELQTDWANGGRLDLILDAASAPSAATVADAVWDEVLSGHLTAGTTGNALNAAGSAGDPWSTALPGAYGAGTAGLIIGTNLNATVSSRASQTSLDTVDDLLDTEVAAIKTVVDAILVDTTEIGVAGAGLTNINLPNQTMDIVGNITGNLSGSVGSVTGAVGSVTGAVGSVTGAVGSVTGLTASDVGAIKTKTDSLTFTVAGHVDANVQRINDVAITGDGGATPFNVV